MNSLTGNMIKMAISLATTFHSTVLYVCALCLTTTAISESVSGTRLRFLVASYVLTAVPHKHSKGCRVCCRLYFMLSELFCIIKG